jgi:hypothetical protein
MEPEERGKKRTVVVVENEPEEEFVLDRFAAEMLMRLVGDDVQSYLSLATARAALRPLLLPFAPDFVRDLYPDVWLLLSLVTTEWFMTEIENVNGLYADIYLEARDASDLHNYPSYMMGFYPWQWYERPGDDDLLSEEITSALLRKNVAEVSEWLRNPFDDRGGESYYIRNFLQVKLRDVPDRAMGLHGFELWGAYSFQYSSFAALHICYEVLRVAGEMRAQWKVGPPRRPRWFRNWTYFNTWPSAKMQQYLEWEFADPWVPDIELMRRFALEFCDSLTGAASDDAFYLFLIPDKVSWKEREVAVSHINSLFARFDERTFAFAEEGDADPLYFDIIDSPTLPDKVCVLIGTDDCDAYWFNLLGTIWRAVSDEELRQSSVHRQHDDDPFFLQTQSRLCCKCGTEATRVDAELGLPFCSQQDCLSVTFSTLKQHRLW